MITSKKNITDKKVAYIAFLECVFSGFWDMNYSTGGPITYTAESDDNCTVALVRTDGLRRMWNFKKGDYVSIFNQVLVLNLKADLNELTVDEDEQQGKPSLSKAF